MRCGRVRSFVKTMTHGNRLTITGDPAFALRLLRRAGENGLRWETHPIVHRYRRRHRPPKWRKSESRRVKDNHAFEGYVVHAVADAAMSEAGLTVTAERHPVHPEGGVVVDHDGHTIQTARHG